MPEVSNENEPTKTEPHNESDLITTKPPFHSFSFTMVDQAIGRRVFRMHYQHDTDDYELHIESGQASDPDTNLTRQASRAYAESLFNTLRSIDAFNWESEYGDSAAPGTRRWNMHIVLQEDVFSMQVVGGSSVPEGFDQLLEALYQHDLPRPTATQGKQGSSATAAGFPGGVPDLGALFASTGGPGGPDPEALKMMQEQFAQMQQNPSAFAAQMKDEFRHLPREQQNIMLDMLASSGLGTREWWKRFFLG